MQIILCIFFLSIVQSKLVSFQIPAETFLKQDWVYLTKFGGHIGKTNFQISMKLVDAEVQEIVKLQFAVYIDEKWEEVLKTNQCQRKKFAHARKNLVVRKVRAEINSFVAQAVRQHLWYFAVDDCDHLVKRYLKDKAQAKLQIDIHITNSNGSEFSSEETGIIYLVLILSIANSLIFLYNAKMLQLDYKKNEEIYWPLAILIIAVGLEVLHNYFHLGHLIAYTSNGHGLQVFQFLSEVFETLSRFNLTLLLVLIAWGWSIKFILIQQFDYFFPIGKLSLLDSFKFQLQDQEKQAMIVMISIISLMVGQDMLQLQWNLVFLSIFIWEFRITKIKDRSKFNNFCFISQFTAHSIFQAFHQCQLFLKQQKTIIHYQKILAPYLRYKFIIAGTSLVKLFAILFLGILFNSKHCGFSSISYKNVSILDRPKEQ